MRDALNKTSTQQFMKFAAVGIFSFVVDWLLLVILTEGFGIDYLVSTTVSFLVSVSLNYALSMKYVFEHRDDMSRKREFTIFAITDVLMFAGVTILNIAYQAMKVIATFCVTWYNFFTRKKFLSATN